ncbi:hypothetical protein VNI00_008295 [Paramarasmius palmivorus]|uniref:PIN domain-containing protein n=1 Tax=Paramarasmius palmivorus TaxID=297713 RepID=A0AAW0CXW0_9AGAR
MPNLDERKGPTPTNLDERLIAFKRRTAKEVATRPKEKTEKGPLDKSTKALPPSTMTRGSPKRPQVVVHRPSPDADPEDFSRRLNISSHNTSPRPSHATAKSNHPSKLYNPERDPIPTMRRTAEPEAMSDTASSNRPSREKDGHARQLFDPRKDDPVRFQVLSRPQQQGQRPTPTPKSSGEYISASSTSSYAASQISSTFTLSSNTDGSSTSSALFDQQGKPHDEGSGTNIFAVQLKKLYRLITTLELKVQKEEESDKDSRDNNRILLKGKSPQTEDDEAEKEKEKWVRQIEDHKKLVETIHNLLEISLAPSVPASLRNIPTKYNIVVRLWTFGFHKLLENLRRASFSSPLALEHLQDFIYYAYTFYTGLLEEPPLAAFKSGWLEALGDLARYRMMVAAMITGGTTSGSTLTATNVAEASARLAKADAAEDQLGVPAAPDAKSVSDAPAARIDDSPSPSVGVAAARALEIEPEVERWRTIARDWYGKGLADQPGTGRLHQHLGLLSRDVPGEELRAVYHFVKSMMTLHPFMLSRESILPVWSHEAQEKRQLPDATVAELFVLLHGMLFTNIQLDDFHSTILRFIERLALEGAEEREWIMMAVINISAILEYNKPNSVLKRCGGIASREPATRVIAKKEKDEDRMDVDDDSRAGAHITPPASDAEQDAVEAPMAFKLALELTFAMLSHVLRRPTRKASPYARSRVNPYLTIILTFLATMLKHDKTLEVMERSIPWEDLANFFTTIPRSVMQSQQLMGDNFTSPPDGTDRWPMLTSHFQPPLPEDWCMRGMEWVGRKVFERGYWNKTNEDVGQAEIDTLDATEVSEVADGRIEDEDEDNTTMDEKKRRYVRIVRSAVSLAGVVKGFTWVPGTREWRVEGFLADKVQQWKELERIEKEKEERRKMGTRWNDEAMEVDEEGYEGAQESSDDDDENDPPEIKELKERRRYLQSLLQEPSRMEQTSHRHPRKKEGTPQQLLPIAPGYTVLVVDTNILLSSLSMFASLVESLRWTVLVPLPVVMELDGLKSNSSPQLSEAADSALSYITSHLRSHSSSLKVQTSKGNYLTTLNVRTEEVDFTRAERSMDDLILKTAIWHDEHWTDRSAMLKPDERTKDIPNPVKVVLLSLDRNLRLKARSRQLPAASEKDLARLLTDTT